MATDSVRPGRSRERRRALLLVLALAFVIRAGWGLSQAADDPAAGRLPDEREYLELARNLLDGRGLEFLDPRFGDLVHAFRTPGYPAFVAALGARVRVVRVAQAAVDTSTVLAVYLLARALLGSAASGRGPLIAAILVAVNPFLVYFSGLLLSETLFTALLAWGMLLLVVGGRGARLRLPGQGSLIPEEGAGDNRAPPPRRGLGTLLWLAGGLLLAGSALVRPSAMPLAVVMGIAAAFVNRLNQRAATAYEAYPPQLYRWPWPVGATMVLLTVVVLLPWAARNRRVLGQWVWATTNQGLTLYDGFNPDADGGSDQSALSAMPQLRSMGEVGRSEYLELRAREFIREYPARAAQLAVIKAGRTWSPVPLSREFGSRRNRAIALLYAVPFDLLVLAGLASGRARPAAKAFLLLPALYFTVVHMLSVGSLRYRIPVEPPMAVLAASVFGRPPLAWRRERGGEVTA